MDLRHIERGAKLIVYEELHKRAVSDEHEAVFRYHENDNLIVIHMSGIVQQINIKMICI